ncbi:uncharacterized protein LOC143424029 [Xylocopa sonorina]|uniref:uncharacterized protein LOC143424029 n=1 Tax=Xylocopa sonorina TaxID=1818115 RepID=UPI00403B29DF
MQENCDFQTALLQKKHSAEMKLDTEASIASSMEIEIEKSLVKDSSVALGACSTILPDVSTRTEEEFEKNERILDQQTSLIEFTADSIPEVDNEDDSNWLSYFDCNAIFDVTCENLSYYNSTKAEKDSGSDFDDTLMFDDAEEGEPLVSDENDRCFTNSCRQQPFENACKENCDSVYQIIDNSDDPVVTDKISATDFCSPDEQKGAKNIDVKVDEENVEHSEQSEEINNSVVTSNEEEVGGSKLERKISDRFNLSSDSDEDGEQNLVYSSSTVNISDYFKFRDSMKEPKLEATLNQPNRAILSNVEANERAASEEKDKSTEDRNVEETRTEGNLFSSTGDTCLYEEKETKNIQLNSPVEYLEKLAQITESRNPKTEEEVRETLQKIAESKAEIENRKNEALNDLSMEFDKIDKLVSETRSDEVYTSESDASVDETEGKIDDIEMPLTKDQIAKDFKSKNSRWDVDEMEKRCAESLQECVQVISKKVEIGEEPIQDEGKSENLNYDIDKPEASKKNNGRKSAEATVNGIIKDVIDDTEDSLFWQFGREPGRTYIRGKVYDFDEKKHGVRMTEDFLKKHCKTNRLYQTPYLNDVLYLHFKGFSFIENLEKYTGLKCLWLENNGIREIANLENQSELRCLYLQNNLINRIENLDYLTRLDTLNLSYNTIRRIENLDSLKFLNTLNLSHNYLQNTDDIEHLRLLDSLSVLDISHNRIDTGEVVNILGDMKELRVAYLLGNPVLKAIKFYRKTMILKCKNLRYLDDRPVFPRDRACAEAWMRGGPDEEVAERKRWIEAEQKKINDSVQAQINKRKLYKPVVTSKKEPEDKKKTKEDEEEVARRTVVCTSNELLHLEKKKKSDAPLEHSSSSSASSSSDEEAENARVYDGMGQKGIEKSDGRKPMAEEGRKASPGIGREILLPWKTEVYTSAKPRKLMEEVQRMEEYVAGDAERKRIGREILEERKSVDDPSGGYALGRELVHYEQLILNTSNQTKSTTVCCQQGKNDIKEEKELLKSTSVSCDIVLSKSKENIYVEELVNSIKNENSSNDSSDNYQRNDNPHPLSSQLTSIREDMKNFCSGMDKFVEENKIVFENGDVKRFWDEKKVINSATKSKSNDESEEIMSSVIMEEKRRNQPTEKWWNTKERKSKVKEILQKREEEVQRSRNINKIEIIDDDKRNVSNSRGETKETKEDLMSQGVYDLLNLKTSPKILLNDIKIYPENEDDSIFCTPVKEVEKEERFLGAFDSLFDEIKRTKENVVKSKETSKPISCQDLLTIEEENEGVEEVVQFPSNTDIISSNVNSSKLSSDQKMIKKGSIRTEILEVNPVNSTDDDESDNESVKTVINTYEKSIETNAEIIVQKTKPKIIQVLNMQSQSDVTSLHDGKSIQSSKLYKRIHDREHVDADNKKSCLIQETDTKKDYDNKENTSDLYDRFGQHLIKEATNFIKKESPSVLHNESIAQLLIPPEIGVNPSNECANLYQQFCKHLERMNMNGKKLLIEPDFMKDNKEKSEEKKCDVSLREKKQLNDKQTKPLVEIFSENPRNIENLVEKPKEPPVAVAESIAMDAALRSKILTSMNAPKSEEQRERGKKSANKLIKISREAMAKGKSLIEQSFTSYNQQLHFNDSRRFFMDLLKEEPVKEAENIVDPTKTIEKMDKNIADTLQNSVVKIENAARLSSLDDDGNVDNEVYDIENRNVGRLMKSLEMQIVQQK